MNDTWYCQHDYVEGRGCPDCDVPAHWPTVLHDEDDDDDEFVGTPDYWLGALTQASLDAIGEIRQGSPVYARTMLERTLQQFADTDVCGETLTKSIHGRIGR